MTVELVEPVRVPADTARALVVVPAHSERAGVRRCLESFLEGFEPGELAVVVVVNGSTDDTAAHARHVAARHPDVAVVELPAPSKPAALRRGARHLGGVPVVVVDADVQVTARTLRAVLDAVDRPGTWVAGARPELRVTGASALVRRYHRVWAALAVREPDFAGSGVVGLSVAARPALDALPDVTNDDGWLRRSVPPQQRVVVDGPAQVEGARTLRALVSRRARIVNGNRQLAQMAIASAGGAGHRVLAARRRGVVSTADVVAFLFVTALARSTAWWRRLRRDDRWGTDSTTRSDR